MIFRIFVRRAAVNGHRFLHSNYLGYRGIDMKVSKLSSQSAELEPSKATASTAATEGRRSALLSIMAAGGALALTACEKITGADVAAPASAVALKQATLANVSLSYVQMAALRAAEPPTTDGTLAYLQGFHSTDDGGGGVFCWRASSIRLDDGGLHISPNLVNSAKRRGRWVRQFSGAVNAKWFGAMGDGSGKTPSDTGNNIASAPFNRWPALVTLGTAAYNPASIGYNLSTAPFSQSDSWDFIGIQLARWSFGSDPEQPGVSTNNVSGAIHVSTGTYVVTQAIQFFNFMSLSIFGDGPCASVINTKSGYGKNGATLLIVHGTTGYRVIRDLGLLGPQQDTGMGTAGFAVVRCINAMGWLFDNCHVAGGRIGIELNDSCADFEIKSCLLEYNQISLAIDTSSTASVHHCEFWTSPRWDAGTGFGIKSAGTLRLSSCLFRFCRGACVESKGTTLITGCEFDIQSDPATLGGNMTDYGVVCGDGAVITGNTFLAPLGSLGASLLINSGCSVTGNTFLTAGDHACVGIGPSAQFSVLTGNVFRVNYSGAIPPAPAYGGALIIANGSAASCMVSNNVFNVAYGCNLDASTNLIQGNLMPRTG